MVFSVKFNIFLLLAAGEKAVFFFGDFARVERCQLIHAATPIPPSAPPQSAAQDRG